MAVANRSVLQVQGAVTLDFGNGFLLQIQPMGAGPSPARRGRKPSKAVQVLSAAMASDAAMDRVRTRNEYLDILNDNGHSNARTASMILAREAKRAFGRTLERGQGAAPRAARPKKGPRRVGRPSAPMTELLRRKLEADKAKGSLNDASYYTRWLVDKANVGLKKAKPVVYRELRAAR